MTPVLRPLLPPADALLPYLRQVDEGRWYTNNGPLVQQFERRLADHFAVDPNQLTTASNATLALSLALRALGAPAGSLCVMPSWTFVATAAAIVWAGLVPYFIDVDPDTWLVEPDAIKQVAAERPGGRDVGAAIVVSAFGAPFDTHAWDAFTNKTGIPILIDAAAGFDSFPADGQPARTPVVISLHATKVFGVGEGAVAFTRDPELAQRIRAYGNFGFAGSRDATVQGVNAKMPEFAAATGLAQFDRWDETRAAWAELTEAFFEAVGARPHLRLAPGFGEGWVSSFGLIQLPPTTTAQATAALLLRRGVETRLWWGEGCHRQTAYADIASAPLPRTERLGQRVLGLPFWLGLRREDIAAVFHELDGALARAKAA